jgi:hypothetical protein
MVITKIHCEAELGKDIYDFAKELVELKKYHADAEVEGKFNEVPLVVAAETTEKDIVEAYHNYLPNFLNKE